MRTRTIRRWAAAAVLAGGVSVNVTHPLGYRYLEGGIVSPDGHCRTFDARAQGTIFGSGVGVVVLKRLDATLRDGDSVLAVIKGSAVNNDGAVKVSYMAPSVDGQAQVIAMAQALAGFDAETISYVEAHGTATNLGDPIEMGALGAVFVYQGALLYRHEQGLDLNVGLKAFLKAAG